MENTGPVVELAIFKTNEGVTREELLATVEPVSEWARQQPGFISRDLTYASDTNTWIDVLWWESLGAAHAAAEAAMTSESCSPMFALIDMQATQMIHGERVIPTVTGERAPIRA